MNAAADARKSADTAAEKAEIATQKAEEIKGESKAAAASATKAQSYAVGGTGSRDGEDTDNAQYYYEQVKRVSQGLNGIIPMGTVEFADRRYPAWKTDGCTTSVMILPQMTGSMTVVVFFMVRVTTSSGHPKGNGM